MVLVVGLGNPTNQYASNRHNIGFMVIDALVDELKATSISKSQFQGELFKTSKALFLKPTTYMNLSGQSVRAVCDYFKPDEVVVIHDDLDLGFGVVKFKYGGGHGGHNGLRSIDSHIGNDYFRVRLGIGKPEDKNDVAKYVLDDFTLSQKECLSKVISHAKEAIIELFKSSPKEIIPLYTRSKGLCQ